MPASRNDPRGTVRRLLRWYAAHRRDLPWRRTHAPYRIWVAEIMLQQTTVRAVLPHYRRFLRRFPSLRALATARPDQALAAWSGLGYYRRARHLHAAARRIEARHGGRFPRDFDAILALPGVGRYTAGAIASIAFGDRRPVVDGNVARVLSRLDGRRGDPRSGAATRLLWERAETLVRVAPDPGSLNQALMELGATICLPVAPACPRCPVASRCAARVAGLQDLIPPPRKRPAVRRRHATVVLVGRGGRFLMRRRGGSGMMQGLWEFPTTGLDTGPDGATAPGAAMAAWLHSGRRVGRTMHTIATRRYAVAVRLGRMLAEPPPRGYRFIDPARLGRLPVSSLVAKVLAAAGGRPRDAV
ncbi:MAG: A/G-specific adenine glycosylase [Candidatus Polarisedimenticolia bacterium]